MGVLQNIKNLFGIKDEPTVQAQQSKEAFFLDADSAKTFGDIGYMRESKAVERTFPKVEGMNVGGLRQVNQFSSTEAALVFRSDDEEASAPAAAESSSTTEVSSSQPTETRKPSVSDGGSIDFRSMARDIKR